MLENYRLPTARGGGISGVYFLFVAPAAVAQAWFSSGRPLDGVKLPVFSGNMALGLELFKFF